MSDGNNMNKVYRVHFSENIKEWSGREGGTDQSKGDKEGGGSRKGEECCRERFWSVGTQWHFSAWPPLDWPQLGLPSAALLDGLGY